LKENKRKKKEEEYALRTLFHFVSENHEEIFAMTKCDYFLSKHNSCN
jgi:hypothetical protein